MMCFCAFSFSDFGFFSRCKSRRLHLVVVIIIITVSLSFCTSLTWMDDEWLKGGCLKFSDGFSPIVGSLKPNIGGMWKHPLPDSFCTSSRRRSLCLLNFCSLGFPAPEDFFFVLADQPKVIPLDVVVVVGWLVALMVQLSPHIQIHTIVLLRNCCCYYYYYWVGTCCFLFFFFSPFLYLSLLLFFLSL
ncbi:hypothetical protein QBC44DRAFT_133846 [Cladorrhinum sp. PSN332]|nr:hypothetical protein QBC44DRAFT_133846 [Cladorrhinum sp. PSN332]